MTRIVARLAAALSSRAAEAAHFRAERLRRLRTREAELTSLTPQGDVSLLQEELTESRRAVQVLEAECRSAEAARDAGHRRLESAIGAARAALADEIAQLRARREADLVAADLADAVASFSDELAAEALDPKSATPAQLRCALAALSASVQRVRDAVREAARVADATLREDAGRSRLALEVTASSAELGARRERARAHVQRSHAGPNEPVGLLQAVLDLDARSAERLRRDVFDQLRKDAEIERRFGLVGRDPLRDLSEALRRLK